jgi:hypothetical protein
MVRCTSRSPDFSESKRLVPTASNSSMKMMAGKTLLARACAAETNATFLKLAGPQLVQMFIGDGAKLVDDGGRLLLGQGKAVAHKLGTVSDEHLHQLGSSEPCWNS